MDDRIELLNQIRHLRQGQVDAMSEHRQHADVRRCEVCGNEILTRSRSYCSEGCRRIGAERSERARDQRTAATRTKREAAGRRMCNSTILTGRLCANPTLVGATVCYLHADGEEQYAHTIGRALAELAVDDTFCAELTSDHPHRGVIDQRRTLGVLRELHRQAFEDAVSTAGTESTRTTP